MDFDLERFVRAQDADDSYALAHSGLFDSYRTFNTEATLSHLGEGIIIDLHKWLAKRSDPAPRTQLKALFPYRYFDCTDHTTWETLAYRLDALLRFILADPNLSIWAAERIKTHSLLRS
ncbi:MAG: hypothetical protein HDR80_07370 [Bacteroides sp.]|nr:hypothetical protein [Bacteroides sp.]